MDPLFAGANAGKASPILAGPRSVIAVNSHLSIPVWPWWAGGRVVPVSLGGPLQDPFLLLAHQKHWFDPKDPLRQPFQQVASIVSELEAEDAPSFYQTTAFAKKLCAWKSAFHLHETNCQQHFRKHGMHHWRRTHDGIGSIGVGAHVAYLHAIAVA
ncbi:expressed unknown protein [Seminavis robusta]|uniref:Uncharacterized protein n=1 Tax=Seminavis robusta TaxID=568900 RepID=A0A9N8DM44_9STRA|nr:expressed unknown protein [Seminavis robusta]|eukprot:Sro131_g062360.1 n/a (156) ;mRNA; r:87068-87535